RSRARSRASDRPAPVPHTAPTLLRARRSTVVSRSWRHPSGGSASAIAAAVTVLAAVPVIAPALGRTIGLTNFAAIGRPVRRSRAIAAAPGVVVARLTVAWILAIAGAVAVASVLRVIFFDAHVPVAIDRDGTRMLGAAETEPVIRAPIVVRIEVSVTMAVIAVVRGMRARVAAIASFVVHRLISVDASGEEAEPSH